MNGTIIAILGVVGYLLYQNGGLDALLSAGKTDTPAAPGTPGTTATPATGGTTLATQTPSTIAVGEFNPSTPVASVPVYDPYGGGGTTYTVPVEDPYTPEPVKWTDPLLYPTEKTRGGVAYVDPVKPADTFPYTPVAVDDPYYPPTKVEPVYTEPVKSVPVPYDDPWQSPPYVPPMYEDPIYTEPIKQPVIDDPILITPIDGKGDGKSGGRQTRG